MSDPPPLTIAEYQRLVQQSRQTVIWALDEAAGPWELEPGDTPAAGTDWFFLVNFPRTGSSVAREILSRHDDIFCGDEHLVLPLFMTLLHSKLLVAPELWYSVRYTKKVPVTPGNVRELMDAWRRCASDKPIFGDKGEMYFHSFGEACSQVFPGCRFVLTVRHPLDVLSSYIHQPWAGYMRDDATPDGFLEQMRSRAREMLIGNTRWRPQAEVIEFDELTSKSGFRSAFSRVFLHLGVDPTRYEWERGWALCQHQRSVGRWKHDTEVIGFMDWLETRDQQLHGLLASGARYLESDLELD